MSESPELDARPDVQSNVQPPVIGTASETTRRKAESNLVKNYNWAAGGMLAYLFLLMAVPALDLDMSSLGLRIACSVAGWICVLFSISVAFKTMDSFFADMLTLAVIMLPRAEWVAVPLILVIATQKLRKSGYSFGLFGYAKLSSGSTASTATD